MRLMGMRSPVKGGPHPPGTPPWKAGMGKEARELEQLKRWIGDPGVARYGDGTDRAG